MKKEKKKNQKFIRNCQKLFTTLEKSNPNTANKKDIKSMASIYQRKTKLGRPFTKSQCLMEGNMT